MSGSGGGIAGPARAAGVARSGVCVIALVLMAGSWVGCSTTTRPATPSISGRVRLTGQLRDAAGDPLGSQRDENANGVRVDLVRGRVVVDSTVTTNGGYRFRSVRSGTYSVRCHGAGPVIDSTLAISVTTRHVVVGDTLELASSGEIGLAPNPFSTYTTLTFSVTSLDRIVLEVRNVSGARVRTITEGTYPLGRRVFRWDGTDDTNTATGPSPYWVTFQQGAHFAAELLFK